jgi:hypothetical protein
MNLSSDFCLSQMRKFDVHDSQKMSISQKLAMIDRGAPTASRFLADK